MGTCLSKKSANASSPKPLPTEVKIDTQPDPAETKRRDLPARKEIFIIKHRNSHEIERRSEEEESKSKNLNGELANSSVNVAATPVRTSSCTKEELDAILIQCGRLSRSLSTGKAIASSGSSENGGGMVMGDRESRQRRRRSHSPGGRRRTLSRERSSNGGRRVSKSPGRRLDSPITSSSSLAAANGDKIIRPTKMVSVPATVSVSTLPMGKISNSTIAVKRIQVKRNVGGSPVSLSRSNSRKADDSPCRRNPLSEIDNNVVKKTRRRSSHSSFDLDKNLEVEELKNPGKNPSYTTEDSPCRRKPSSEIDNNVVVKIRKRSSHLSHELDMDLEESSNPTRSYNALLLQDIDKFHKTNNVPSTFSVPTCLTKAYSILDAVADLNLNTTTSSNLSTNLSRGRQTEKSVESSGSNILFSGQRNRDSSSLDCNSADSTDGFT